MAVEEPNLPQSVTSDDAQLTAQERALLLDMLRNHKNEYIKEFLKANSLKRGGKKDDLFARIEEGIETGKISDKQLIDLLDRIEEYGNQHTFLYCQLPIDLNTYKNPIKVQEILENANLLDLYNSNKTLFLPEKPRVSSITHDNRELTIKWVEKKTVLEPIEEEIEGDTLTRKYKIKHFRGASLFRLNLLTGTAELFIKSVSRGEREYDKSEKNFWDQITLALGINSFPKLDLSKAIERIEASGEADNHQIIWETSRGSKMNFKSPDQNTDYRDDQTISKALEAAGNNLKGELGNFYWLPDNGIIEKRIHTKVYANSNKVYFMGERIRSEVDHVLSRIRHYS
ncbi:MAG TPA: hypothetical protein V6C52_11365 [Coleofasciculaceae cyanobacterium]|jgi:hypothetical protein